MSLCSVVCHPPWRLAKISYLGFDESTGLLSKWHFFFHGHFFYSEKIYFLLQQISEAGSARYLLFLLVFSSNFADIQEIKVPVLRPEGRWCLEGV